MRLENKIALITGAGRGIGRAIAERFAAAGADIIVNYRADAAAAAAVVDAVKAAGRSAMAVQADVSVRAEVQALMGATIERFGRLDILVNNAGVNKTCFFDEITDEDWDWLMNTNLKGPFMCCQEAFPLLKETTGRIINISSAAAQYHGPKTVHYAVSKAGLISLTKVLARYGAEHGVLVNAVAPGLIETDLTRDELKTPAGKAAVDLTLLKRAGQLADVTSACLFLAAADENYMTGQVLSVSGGAVLG